MVMSGIQSSGLSTNVDIGVSSVGSAKFDYQDDAGERISPRKVAEMHYYSEQDGNFDDWIVLKVTDPAHQADTWVRFRPASEGYSGDFTQNPNLAIPQNSALRASLQFDNPVEYKHAIDTRSKVFKQAGRLHTKPDEPAICAPMYAENLSLQIGQGVGRCTPQDLCEIWPSLPDSDRRLQAFYWYEQTDGSGIEYIVLHVVGSSSFSETQNWWVRLERDGANDEAVISRNQKLVVIPGSQKRREVVFRDGISFDNVIQVLRDIPAGFDLTTEDCWYYASTLAHRLSAEVGDDLFECPIEDLMEIWSGERGAKLFVNRIQWFQGAEEDSLEHLILNVSAAKHDRHGLWVRLGQDPVIGSLVDTACVTRNRRHLLRSDPIMLADVTFSDLRFGKVMQVLKQLNRELANMFSFDANQVSKAAMTVQKLTEIPDQDCYWVEGDFGLLSASFSQVRL
ncbi:hypothetical protein FRC07_014429 [Ceratobasidium sp. 392]|nr:hypothetical protein FRC07_014429 [Ceratobasidium sp. 392]